MAARIALGLVAVMRAALIYGDGAELADRSLEWPGLPRLRGEPAAKRPADIAGATPT